MFGYLKRGFQGQIVASDQRALGSEQGPQADHQLEGSPHWAKSAKVLQIQGLCPDPEPGGLEKSCQH